MSARALLKPENLVSAPIEDGDAGFILKPNGDFKVFSTGAIDADNLTEAQKAQGEKLLALTVAVSTPEIMDMLIKMSRDPRFVGVGVDLGRLN